MSPDPAPIPMPDVMAEAVRKHPSARLRMGHAGDSVRFWIEDGRGRVVGEGRTMREAWEDASR
jgi:hypothetical protein